MSSSTPVGSSRTVGFAIPARKTTMAAPVTTTPKEPKSISATKQHKRSRSGCFTCRLRRKKCDEARPACRACKHLGLQCDYKRPQWWGNSDLRRAQKEYIKNIIKQTQATKKTLQNMSHGRPRGSTTPPGLSHSLSTPETFSDSFMSSCTHSRADSSDKSPLIADSGLYGVPPEGYFAMTPRYQANSNPRYPMSSPYELDVKTERHVSVTSSPIRRDSTISTFSSFHTPVFTTAIDSPMPQDMWHGKSEDNDYRLDAFSGDQPGWELFDIPYDQLTPALDSAGQVDGRDRPLLEHFFEYTSRLLFPVLDATRNGSARTCIVLPALETNVAFRHCCLSIAGMHKKAVECSHSSESSVITELDEGIMRHRFSSISELCNELQRDENHEQILETTLSMIFFPTCVGTPEDAMTPDIPWHHHLHSAKTLIESLQYPAMLLNGTLGPAGDVPFSMTLFAWIDILGATMRGRSPLLADVYRELNIAKRRIGLQGLMGCDDNLMYLISEIACLEERRSGGMEETMLCKYIEILGTQITLNELSDDSATVSPLTTTTDDEKKKKTSVPRPEHVTQSLSAVFRLAARVYLCSLVPGFDSTCDSTVGLVQGFTDALARLPRDDDGSGGEFGFDRSLAWPFLVVGSVAPVDSPFKPLFVDRHVVAQSGHADIGSLARVKDILLDLWPAAEAFAATEPGPFAPLHWRTVMAEKSWDCLLI